METTKTRQAVNALKNTIRHPFAWPGGYPVYVVLSDGETLCRECTRKEYKRLLADTRDNDSTSGWNVVDAEILWEGEYYCAHCSKQIETAYGEETEK